MPSRNSRQQHASSNRQPQGGNRTQYAQGRRPSDAPLRDREHSEGTIRKVIKPVSSGKAFAIGLLSAFIVFLFAAAAVIAYNTIHSSQQNQMFYDEMQNSVKTVQEAASVVNLSPTETAVSKAMSSNVNITIVKNDGTTVYGAGVVISSDGYVMTNSHVLTDAKTITANIAGTTYTANKTGSDDTSDIAVIKCDNAKGLTVFTAANATDVSVGDWVMVVGNPYGLNDSLTTGTVSALGRNFPLQSGSTLILYANMIQTDAAINPGNSGGGLYDSNGKLVGINTLITSNNNNNSGIGYAIPITYANNIAVALMSGKQAPHAALGLSLSDVPNDAVKQYGLTSSDGAYITNVTQSGPAATAGLVNHDIIVEFDGKHVANANDLIFKIRAKQVNDQTTIKILREGKEMSFTVKLGSDV